MRKKQVIGAIAVVLFGALLTCATLPQFQVALPSAPALGDANGKDVQEESTECEHTSYSLENIEQWQSAILESNNEGLFAGYPVDESFLLWIVRSYGQESLEQIAKAVTEEVVDAEVWYQVTGQSMHVLWLLYCQEMSYASYWLEPVIWQETANASVTTIDMIGDINLADDWYTMKAYKDRENNLSECISSELIEELSSADITLANNEFTYGTEGEPLSGKTYTFQADPSNIEILDTLGVDIVSVANNHVYDYGEEGLLTTLKTLENSKMPYIGAGRNQKEASAITYFVANGRKIAFVSATQIEKFYNYTKEATADTPGVLKTLDQKLFNTVIEDAKQHSDYVVVYVHWGTEGKLFADSDQRALAEGYIKSGADLIIGNHAHRLQGVEYIEGVPVIYGLGNFWFSTGKLYTTVVQYSIAADGSTSVRLLPCVQNQLTTSLLAEDKTVDFYHYVSDLSKNVAFDENGTVYSMKNQPETVELWVYRSDVGYRSHSGGYDLKGNAIDIVGNIK